jgi:hypothetical protein
MAANLEVGVGEQLLGAFFMGLHPFAAGKECRQPLSTKQIDNTAVVAGDVRVGLAEVKGKRDELSAWRKLDVPDRAAQLLRHGSCCRQRNLL